MNRRTLSSPRRATALFIFALALFGGIASAEARVRIVATTPDLAAIAAAVGGDEVEVRALSAPSQDPHYVDARPSLLVPMSRADLLMINGLELEVGWLPSLQTNARNAAIQTGARGFFDASSHVTRQQVPTRRIDRSMGDVHPGGNPHFTFDPRRGVEIARALADTLSHLEPGLRSHWEQGAERFAQELEALAQRERARFASLPAEARKVVSYHQSLVYLFDWLQLEEVATIEPLPGIDPNPRHTASVLQTMRAQGVDVVIQEEFYPRSVSNTLCSMTGAELVVIEGGTRFESGQSYVEHIEAVVDAIYSAVAE